MVVSDMGGSAPGRCRLTKGVLTSRGFSTAEPPRNVCGCEQAKIRSCSGTTRLGRGEVAQIKLRVGRRQQLVRRTL